VAKPELGTKRLCGNCGAKFYDLLRNPIVCPKCSTVFVPPTATRGGGRPEAARAAAEPVDEVAAPEAAEAEFVPLEEADKEAEGGAKSPVAEGDDEVEDEALDDTTFIVPEEEEDEDVTDIIGDGIEDDEET
jgi:uncharacterized protein (TIGR02300 family)